MKVKYLTSVLMCLWAGSSIGATVADALSQQYNNLVTNSSGGVTTRINAASQSSGTCDLTGCGVRMGLPSMGTPAADLSGVPSVKNLFTAMMGRTVSLSLTGVLYFSVGTQQTLTALITPISSTSARVEIRCNGFYSTRGSNCGRTLTMSNVGASVQVTTPFTGAQTANSAVVSATPNSFNMTWTAGGGYYNYNCQIAEPGVGSTSLSTDQIASGVTSNRGYVNTPPRGASYCSTCFPAGSLVLMADGTWKAIQFVQKGDMVMGAMGAPVEVETIERPLLGGRRMMAMEDGSMHWSEEHLIWSRKQGDDAEWWWSESPDTWRAEVQAGDVVGLKDNYSLNTGSGWEFAHLSGWQPGKVTHAKEYGPETQLYLPITDGTPIIVNGYVVTAGTNEFLCDYTQLRWEECREKVFHAMGSEEVVV